MWKIAGGIILAVVLLIAGLVASALLVSLVRWLLDLPGEMRAKKIRMHNALLAEHGLSPSDLTPEQLVARYRGEWIDPSEVKPRIQHVCLKKR